MIKFMKVPAVVGVAVQIIRAVVETGPLFGEEGTFWRVDWGSVLVAVVTPLWMCLAIKDFETTQSVPSLQPLPNIQYVLGAGIVISMGHAWQSLEPKDEFQLCWDQPDARQLQWTGFHSHQ